MTKPAAPFRLRPDLIHRQIWSGGQRIWVVKDPLARSFNHFDEQEYALLKLADGQRGMNELYQQADQLFTPKHLTARQVIAFFADAKSKGLLVCDSPANSNEPSRVTGSGLGVNPLAIRMPGIDPMRFLDFLAPLARPLGSIPVLVVALLLIFAAGIITVARFGELVSHVTTAAGRFDNLFVFVIVIAVTKIIHEFAHAAACRRFGGQCGEVGVMFLVGVPCLYCDVSDAWMVDRPGKRILISAAGMLAELTLAALATFVWIATVDGPVRDVCVTVMVVCSVSTLLFNGNPLLKYDGYYILSDLIGIPNLYARSRSELSHFVTRRILGASTIAEVESDDPLSTRMFLVLYAIASGTYRVFVYAALFALFYAWADSLGFGWFVVVGASVLLLTAIKRSVKSMHRRMRGINRPSLVAVALFEAAFLALIVPLPRTVVAPMMTQPVHAETIVASHAGFIQDAVADGVLVEPGDTVARLQDDETELQEYALMTRRNQLRSKLLTIRDRRGFDEDATAAIPATSQALAETEKQLSLLSQQRNRLTLRTKASGIVFSPIRVDTVTADNWQAKTWGGTPLDAANRSCRLDAGADVCVVGDANEREAIVYLRQQDIESVRVGQRVMLRVADRGRGSVAGVVAGLANSPVREMPDALLRAGWVKSTTIDSVETPHYPVLVRISQQSVALPIRLIATAQIEVEASSLLSRIVNMVSDSF